MFKDWFMTMADKMQIELNFAIGFWTGWKWGLAVGGITGIIIGYMICYFW